MSSINRENLVCPSPRRVGGGGQHGAETGRLGGPTARARSGRGRGGAPALVPSPARPGWGPGSPRTGGGPGLPAQWGAGLPAQWRGAGSPRRGGGRGGVCPEPQAQGKPPHTAGPSGSDALLASLTPSLQIYACFSSGARQPSAPQAPLAVLQPRYSLGSLCMV